MNLSRASLLRRLSVVFRFALIVKVNSSLLLSADSDIEVVSLVVNPQEWVETFSPGQVLFTLKNNGPDDLTQVEGEAPRILKLNFCISDDDSVGEDDELVAAFNAPFEFAKGNEAQLELYGIHRSLLIVPSRAEPYYWYLTVEAEGFTDPNGENNTSFAPLPSVVSAAPSGIWAAFSGTEILTSNLEIFPVDCFVFNQYYGNN